MSEQGKPAIIQSLEKKLGLTLNPGPTPDLLVRDDYALQYALDENNHLIGLNLAGCELQSLELGSEYQHLQVLNVGRTALRSLQIPAEMKALRELRAYECKALEKVELPDTLSQLHYLDQSECALSQFQLPRGLLALTKLYLQKNQLEELIWSEACPALIFAELSENQLNDLALPTGLEHLRFLYLGKNKLNSLHCQGNLPQLEVLDLRNNAFKNIKESFLQHFPRVFTLYLSGNPLNLYLRGNFDENSNKNNLPQLKSYFTDLRNGTELDNECKVLLIGDGGAGKSCMVERLVWDSFEQKWLSTHGINIVPYPLGKYQLLLWDFAGQDIYHATHRLFMQADAVYVLAFSKSTQTNTHSELEEAGKKRPYQNYGVLYWWNYAQVLGKGSPILLAQTNWQSDGTWTDADIEALQKANQNRLEILHLDAKYEEAGKNKYAALKLALEEAVASVRPLDEIPASAYALRKALRERRSDKVKSIPYAEYLSMAEECQLERNPHECLINWLDKSGVVYYRKGLFKDQVILDQEWAMNAVYSIFKRDGADAYFHRFVNQKGRVSGADLQMVWKQHSSEEQQLFLSFLESCEMCFELNKEERHQRKSFDERVFIFPQLLPEWKTLEPLISDIWEDKEKLYLRYQHQFLHYGVIQSFIVQTQHTVEDITRSIWRQGILLKEDKQFVQVEAKNDKELLVTITPHSFPLLQKVRNLLAKLQDSPGLESVSSNGVDFVNLEHLQTNRHRPDILGESGKTYVKVKPLLPFLERDEKATFVAEKMLEHFGDKGDATIFNPPAPKHQTMPTIKSLIEASRLKEALEKLKVAVPKHLQNEVTLQLSRINDLARKEHNNIITSDNATIEKAKIRMAILFIYEEAEIQEVEPTNEDDIAESRGIAVDRVTTERDTDDGFGDQSEAVEIPAIEPFEGSLIVPKGADDKTKILFLSANPVGQQNLAVDREANRVKVESQGKALNVVTCPHIDRRSMIDMVAFEKPQIVHFSGHGSNGGLALIDVETNRTASVSNEDLVRMFGLFKKTGVKCVVLCSCWSFNQAKSISALGIPVIGMLRKIGDEEAIQFSRDLYYLLVTNNPLDLIFELAKEKVTKASRDIPSLWYNGKRIA